MTNRTLLLDLPHLWVGGTRSKGPGHEARTPGQLLQEAQRHDSRGQMDEAIRRYDAAIIAAEAEDDGAVLAIALRRLGVVHHRRDDKERARALCHRSHDVALAMGKDVLVAEALNTIAGFDLERGEYDAARRTFRQALLLGGEDGAIRGRVRQNLGILANIQGDIPEALDHYRQSLDAFEECSDDRGRAISFHNLAMIHCDLEKWDEAHDYFSRSMALADTIGDVHLEGLCSLNITEIHLARQHFEDARNSAEVALEIFTRLGAQDGRAAAYRFLGMLYREAGKPALAEARLTLSLDLASDGHFPLEEAETLRELAVLYRSQGRNQEALKHLNVAHRVFRRLAAKADLVDVVGKVDKLEGTYFQVVREWGQSIESADSYTHGHCGRVAEYAVRVAGALGLDEGELTRIRLGAYLHDVGKVRVAPEIINKKGPLTPQEFEVIKNHPVWGLELLAAIEFPWDIKPIIRSHHEKYDGTGYPDGLRGNEIPVAAQIIGIVDMYDAMTTTRSYRPAMEPKVALEQMRVSREWWHPDVFDAFMSTFAQDADHV
jgi:putative nucleotidyltransferase with HDIG domain